MPCTPSTARRRVMPLGRPASGAAGTPQTPQGALINANASESVRRQSAQVCTACVLYCFKRKEKGQLDLVTPVFLETDMLSTTSERRQRRHTVGSGGQGSDVRSMISSEFDPAASLGGMPTLLRGFNNSLSDIC